MNFIDLFAGAGGLSEGFIRQGFKPLAHVEMDKNASLTLKTRMAYWELKNNGKYEIYLSYLKDGISQQELYSHLPSELKNLVINKEISEETIESIFETIDSNMEALGEISVDLIIGGPPCQAYSLVGRSRDPHRKANDPRNYLYKQYIKFLEKYNPKMFVFENVPGIFSAANGAYYEAMKQEMENLGYSLEGKVLDASEYGVLQRRKRVILVGWKNGSGFGYPELQEVEHNHLVAELLEDLIPLEPGESYRVCEYRSEASEYLLKSGIRDGDFVTQHISRPHNEHDRKIYKLAIEKWNVNKERLKYTDLPTDWQTHKNLKSFLDRFKVVAGDLAYSQTMVAHIAKDGHYYIHPDINQLRSLSVREAARIQTFPDNYYFEGPRTAIFTQIGNAVPPILSNVIAEGIKKQLSKRSRSQFSTI